MEKIQMSSKQNQNQNPYERMKMYHSDVVRELEEIGIYSLYHHVYKQEQGSESKPTFYLQRKIDKPYHIDYAFISKELTSSATLSVGEKEIWLEHSDHMPLSVYLNG